MAHEDPVRVDGVGEMAESRGNIVAETRQIRGRKRSGELVGKIWGALETDARPLSGPHSIVCRSGKDACGVPADLDSAPHRGYGLVQPSPRAALIAI